MPTANFTANPLVVCVGVPVNFTNTSIPNGTSAIVSNAWDFGDGALSTLLSPSHAFSTAGTFTITLVVTNANGTVDAEIKSAYITVNPLPIVAFSVNGLGCTVPLTLSFVNSSSSGANFSNAWNFGNSQNSTAANPPNITYNSAGSYTITLNVTNTSTSCVATSTQSIQVANFQAGITAPTFGCVGQAISFQDNSTAGANAWSWNFGGQGTSSVENPSFVFNAPGTYTVQLTSQNTSSGCTSTITQPISIQANTNPIFSANPITNCAPGSIQFTSSTTIPGTYVWSFGDGASSVITSPTHLFANTTSGYTIMLTAMSSLGCADSTLVTIDYQESEVYYIPNSFTPDGDKFNQVFLPIFTAGIDPYNYTMEIYNRWGEVIFETHNMEYGWDGSYGLEGNDCPSGSYTYRIVIKMPDIDERKILVGHVNLIR